MSGAIHDISEEARKVAKLALYAIAGPVLSEDEARAMELHPEQLEAHRGADDAH